MTARTSMIATLLLLSACASQGGGPSLSEMEAETSSRARPQLVEEYISQAAASGAAGAREAPSPQLPRLEAMTQQVEKVKQEIDALIRDPASVALFRPFTTEASRRLQEMAQDPKSLESALEDGITIEEAESILFARNLEIASSMQDLRSTVERYPQVVFVEVLLSQYVTFLSDLMLGAGPQIQKDPVALKFPVPGVLSLKTDLVSREVDIARAQFEMVVREQVVAVNDTFYELWYLDRALLIEREVDGYLKQLEKTVSSRLETGRADKSQVLQVQVEISSLEDDIITIEERKKTFAARLRELLDLDPKTPIGTPSIQPELPAIPAEALSLYEIARKDRQEVRLARDRIRRIETAIELAEKMTYPDWTLGLGYFRGIRPVDRPATSTGVLPEDFGQRPPAARTFWFGQSEAYLTEVRQVRLAMLSSLEAAQRRAEFLVRKEVFALDEAKRKLELYRDVLLSQARQAYEDTQAGYISDRVEFLNVIDSLRKWLRFDLEEDKARRDYYTAYVRLEAAVGAALGR